MVLYLVLALCMIISSSIGIQADEKPRGINAKEGQFPYHAMLYNLVSSKPHSGGSILNEWYVLSSAFAVNAYIHQPDKLVVYVGVTDIRNMKQKLEIDEIKIPDEFEVLESHHDIALIRTKEKIQWTPKVMPIKLPSTAEDFGGELISSSFGIRFYPHHVAETKHRADHLHYHKTLVVPMDKCQEIYRESKLHGFSEDELGSCFICTQNIEGFNFDYGDYGNPLVANGILYGIASYGGGPEGYPNVYTKVHCFRKWIQDNAIVPSS